MCDYSRPGPCWKVLVDGHLLSVGAGADDYLQLLPQLAGSAINVEQ